MICKRHKPLALYVPLSLPTEPKTPMRNPWHMSAIADGFVRQPARQKGTE